MGKKMEREAQQWCYLMSKMLLEADCDDTDVRGTKSLRGKAIILSLPIKAIILFSLCSILSPCTPLTSLSWLQRFLDCLFPCWICALWDRYSNSDFSFSISLPAIIAWMVSSHFQTVIPLSSLSDVAIPWFRFITVPLFPSFSWYRRFSQLTPPTFSSFIHSHFSTLFIFISRSLERPSFSSSGLSRSVI